MFKNFIFLILLIFILKEIFGEICVLKNGKRGYCVNINFCNSALQMIKKREKPPVVCKFQGLTPFICCEDKSNETISTTTTTTVKTTTISKIVEGPGAKSYKFCNDTFFQKIPDGVLDAFGGRPSLAAEFPHMAALGFGDEDNPIWGCGGSLISNKYVITAAHCIYARDLGNLKYVRLGDLNLNDTTDEAEPQNFKVIKAIKYPLYRSNLKYHDLALLELDREIIRTIYVEPICLNINKKLDEKSIYLTATGWGRLEFEGENANHLQVVYGLTEYSNEECRKHYPANRNIPESIVDDWQICAYKENADTCQGDSGGPLSSFHKDFYNARLLIGLTSFGKACGISKSPGVYTRISHYIDWIESIVWPN